MRPFRIDGRWTEELVLEAYRQLELERPWTLILAPTCRNGHPIPFLPNIDTETQPFLIDMRCRLCRLRRERRRQQKRVADRTWTHPGEPS